MASKTSFPYEVVMNLKEIRSDMSHKILVLLNTSQTIVWNWYYGHRYSYGQQEPL